MKMPGAQHPISVTPTGQRVCVSFNGVVIADSMRALTLQESTYRPVIYIPRADARMDLMRRTEHGTHCPYKGDASYYSVHVGNRVSDNAVWSYEAPYPAMAAIAGHLAFYPDRVDTIEQV
jgi:uncharacterized protein (DUF427 family)